MNEVQRFFQDISQQVMTEYPKASILRKFGKLYKLELGEVAILDSGDDVGVLHLDHSGRTSYTEGNRIMLGEITLNVDLKVGPGWNRPKVVEECVSKLVGMLNHKEQGIVADLLAEAVIVPINDYYRVRRLFRDLKKPCVLVPSEQLQDYLKQSLITMVRLDLNLNWFDNPSALYKTITLSEAVAPALTEVNWCPGNG